MKKILLSFLTLLLLGGSLAWGVTVSGTITIQATAEEKSQLNGIKLVVGVFAGGGDVSMLMEFNLPASSSYTYTSMFPGGNENITFALGTGKDCVRADYSSLLAQNWVIVDDEGNELDNPMTTAEKLSGDVTMNLTIKPKSGVDFSTATLIGKVIGEDGPDCLDWIMVTVKNADGQQVAQNYTGTIDSKYASQLGCNIGYEFTDLRLGTYTVSYSGMGLYENQTQTVEITGEGVVMAPTVTMVAKVVDCMFNGDLFYTNAEGESVPVEEATITAYNGAGEDAEVLGEPVQTNASGHWFMTVPSKDRAMVYFSAEHPDIEVASRTAAQASAMSSTKVTIACTQKVVEMATLTLLYNEAMGTVTVNGENTAEQEYEVGTEVTVTATPNEGYLFQAWQEDGADVAGADAVYTFTLDADRTLTAVFEKIPPVMVTLSLGVNDEAMGTVSATPAAGTGNQYEEGTEVTVKAVANKGYKFRAWQEGGEVVAVKAEYTFTLTADRTLTALFVAEPPVVTTVELVLEVNDKTMGMVSGAGTYEKGTEVTVKAFVNDGYVFQAWEEDGETVSTLAEYTFTLNAARTLMAVFEEGESNEERELAAWDIYAKGGRIEMHSNTACSYEVYALSGVLVSYGRMGAGVCNITVDRSGLYMVRRISSTGISVKKVVIR